MCVCVCARMPVLLCIFEEDGVWAERELDQLLIFISLEFSVSYQLRAYIEK